MKTTFPELEGSIDGQPSSGTADRPLPRLPPVAAGASHPDEPRPLFGEPALRTPDAGYEPKDLLFDNATPHEPKKATTVPNQPFSPKPLFADEPTSPSTDRTPAPSASGPGALRFLDVPAAPSVPVRPPVPSSSAGRSTVAIPGTAGLSFKDVPPPVKPGAVGHSLFEATESPLIHRGVEIAQTKYPQLWAEDSGATFQRHLRQLLPLDRASIEGWGSVVLDRVTDMATATARVTRTYLDLNANELLNQALQDARAPAPKMWQRLVKPPVSLDECRLRLKNLREATVPLIAQVDQHAKDAKDATQRLARDLASLLVVTAVSSSIANNGVARSLDDRSSLLTNSLRQAELLGPQLKNLGNQMRDLNTQVDEALSVTFPALALARAARG